MQQLSIEHTQKIVEENKKLRLDLQSMTHELDARSKQLDELVAATDCDRRNFKLEKQRNAMKSNALMLAEQEQQKLDEDICKPIEQYKREKETALHRIKLLGEQLHVRHKLELKIKDLREKFEVLNNTPGTENSELGKRIAELSKELHYEIKEMDYSEKYNQALIVQKNKTAVELQEARKLVIDATQGFPGQTSVQAHIGIRMIGELDLKAFSNVCRQKFPKDDAEVESVKLCSKWQNEISNPNWHPFVVSTVNGKQSEVIREDDKKLQELKEEYGEEGYAAVTTALTELNEHNSSGSRVPFPELWNHKEGRIANIKEIVQHVIQLSKAMK